MKIIIGFILILNLLYGSSQVDVDIKADNFLADKEKNLIVFSGNVEMIKGDDHLKTNKLTVYTKYNEKNETVVQKYIAIGSVDLRMKKDQTTLIAKGDSIVYDVDNQEYLIEGNGYLEDVNDSKIIKGEKIFFNKKTQQTKIDGGKDKPVQFKFKMEEKTDENN
ncbi:MAG TPA: lipopolysaccharide transport periplasmic protein LptA [Flavobacteriia bacterium]|nr:lipopolysaccharide transport periplasmic protein LptA [Flavobacteriia bacterium]